MKTEIENIFSIKTALKVLVILLSNYIWLSWNLVWKYLECDALNYFGDDVLNYLECGALKLFWWWCLFAPFLFIAEVWRKNFGRRQRKKLSQWKPLNVITINVINQLFWSYSVGPILIHYCSSSQTRGRDPFWGRQIFFKGRQSPWLSVLSPYIHPRGQHQNRPRATHSL
jgi:hypothetical protein